MNDMQEKFNIVQEYLNKSLTLTCTRCAGPAFQNHPFNIESKNLREEILKAFKEIQAEIENSGTNGY